MPRDMLVARKVTTLPDQSRVTYNYGLTGYGLSFDRSRELAPGTARPRKVLPDFDAYGFRLYVFAVYSGLDVIYRQRFDGLSILVPYWALALLALVLPLAYSRTLLRRLARRQQRGHLCRACGSDLRATPQRCPECGAVPFPT
jgi:hypothetical protein